MRGSNFLFPVNKRETWMNLRRLQEAEHAYDADMEEEPNPLWNTISNLRLQDQEDRISALPDQILHHILSFMPMQMSVQTSILSTRWRHLWKYTKTVDFHDLPAAPEYSFITRCLDRLQSPHLHSFTVVGHVGRGSPPDVRTWVGFALSKKVHALTIGLMSLDGRHCELPKSLFTWTKTESLQLLFLSWVDFRPPPTLTFSGFASLHSLSFTHCRLADAILQLLLRKCLLLEDLVLDSCPGLLSVNISGPDLKLKHLLFKWCSDHCNYRGRKLLEVDAPGLLSLDYSGDLTNIRLKNSQGLERIILVGNEKEITEKNIDHIRELIHQVTQVKALGFDRLLLQFVAKEYYSKGSPFSKFQNLYQLTWYGSLRSQNDIYNLVAFIRDCPSLESFIMDFREEYWDSFCQDKLSSGRPNMVMRKDGAEGDQAVYDGGRIGKLKSVRMKCFAGLEGEMMVVKLLLEKGVNLEKLVLLWRDHPSVMSDNVLQTITIKWGAAGNDLADLQPASITSEVARFHRASPNVQVLSEHGWEPRRWVSSFGL